MCTIYSLWFNVYSTKAVSSSGTGDGFDSTHDCHNTTIPNSSMHFNVNYSIYPLYALHSVCLYCLQCILYAIYSLYTYNNLHDIYYFPYILYKRISRRIMYDVQCTCTSYTVRRTIYLLHCVHSTTYIVHRTLYVVQYKVFVQCMKCSWYSISLCI